MVFGILLVDRSDPLQSCESGGRHREVKVGYTRLSLQRFNSNMASAKRTFRCEITLGVGTLSHTTIRMYVDNYTVSRVFSRISMSLRILPMLRSHRNDHSILATQAIPRPALAPLLARNRITKVGCHLIK